MKSINKGSNGNQINVRFAKSNENQVYNKPTMSGVAEVAELNIPKSDDMEMRKLSAKILLSAPYQRETKDKRIKAIIRKFDKNKVKPIVVSYRNGKYYVVDGQHTLTVLRMLFGENYIVTVRVLTGLTYDDEAAYYNEQYDNCAKLTPEEHMTSRKEYDSKAKDMMNVCSDAGYILATSKNYDKKHNKKRISCVGTFEKVYDLLGSENTNIMLKLMKETWSDDKESITATFIGGMGEFFKLYGDKIDRNRFVKVFSKKPVAEIVKASYNDSAAFTKTDRVVRAICDVYNYRNKNKLPDISALK